MTQLKNIIRYEFGMSIRRSSLWIAFGLICIFFLLGLNTTKGDGLIEVFGTRSILLDAAETVFIFNMLTPLLAGILASDRLQRDFHINLRELQVSSPTSIWRYIAGKYIGVLLSIFLVGLASTVVHGLVSVIIFKGNALFILAEIAVFTVMIGPAYAFVTAFSLVCPIFIPLRVYQILFTGYWCWGNFISSRLIPSISDTLLNASGMYALQGFFKSEISPVGYPVHSSFEAWINLLILGFCITAVLFSLDRYLLWQQKKA